MPPPTLTASTDSARASPHERGPSDLVSLTQPRQQPLGIHRLVGRSQLLNRPPPVVRDRSPFKGRPRRVVQRESIHFDREVDLVLVDPITIEAEGSSTIADGRSDLSNAESRFLAKLTDRSFLIRLARLNAAPRREPPRS